MKTKDTIERYGTGFREPELIAPSNLEHRFRSRWKAPGSSKAAWLTLSNAYSEPRRQFHTLQHVAECLQIADQYTAIVGWPELYLELELAIWFHDLVYEPGANDNEERSARFFEALAVSAGMRPETVSGAVELILATKNHEASGVVLSGVMGDCDLWIIGSFRERYRKYSEQIRLEHRCFSDWQYRWGRIRFLRGMLKKKRIFSNPLFEETFGAAARQNLSGELKALTFRRSPCLAG